MAILRHKQTTFDVCGQWLLHRFSAIFHLRWRCCNTAKVALIREIGNFTDTGVVKWFNATKGYGFIQPEGGGKDAFVNISAVEKSFIGLAEGAKISYEIVTDRGKESAGNLRI